MTVTQSDPGGHCVTVIPASASVILVLLVGSVTVVSRDFSDSHPVVARVCCRLQTVS